MILLSTRPSLQADSDAVSSIEAASSATETSSDGLSSTSASSAGGVSSNAKSEAAVSSLVISETESVPAQIASSALPETPIVSSQTQPPMTEQDVAPVPEPVVETASEPTPEPAALQDAQDSMVKINGSVRTSGVSFLSTTEEQVIAKINQERQSLGLAPLEYYADAQTAARIRSRELCESKTFAHSRPNGNDWVTVVDVDVPILYIAAGENLAMIESNKPNENSQSSASFWFNQWKNSPPHYENMIRGEYTHVGVGIYYVKIGDVTYAYATTIFLKL